MSPTPALTDLAGLASTYARTHRPDDLQRLRDAVRSSPGFRADLDVVGEVGPLLEAGDHRGALALLRGLMPGAFLSPAAHTALAAAHEGLGDTARAELERQNAWLALASILSTGDGTQERPWSVLRISDEYDVLRSRGLTRAEQRLVTVGGRDLDHLRCTDGSEVWFDVTALGARR